LIPGYEKIKQRSLEEGAMAFTISGAGPSTVAFLDSSKKGLRLSEVMEEEYEKINVKCKTFISRSGNGSKIISLK
jgi:homoserine kinase